MCGTPLTDEFDKVIGLCDVHQRDRRGADGASAGGGAEPQGRWHARTQDGRQAGPMILEDLRQRIRQGEFTPDDEFSHDGENWGPISRYKEIAYLANLAVGGEAAPMGVAPKTSIATPRARPNIGKMITPLMLVVIVGGIAFLAYAQRNKLGEIWDGITKGPETNRPTGINPLKRYLANWRLAHPDVSGTAHEHLVTARARHLEDTWKGYELAEKSYQRALLLDENNAKAIAGFIENLAIWKFALLTPEEIRTARAAAKFATALAPESPEGHRAQAAVSLALGELNGCRSGADKALALAGTDGRAKLLLAGCYMEGNVILAIDEAQRAKTLLPEMRRADRVLAKGYEKVGRFASAIKLLEGRLEADPDNASMHLQLGETYRELADLEKSEEHIKKAINLPGDAQLALLILGDLKIEEGRVSAAIGHYKRAAEFVGIHGERGARAYVGWARGEVMRNRPRSAEKLADRAMAYSPRDPTALLIRGQAALLAGSATTSAVFAKRALDARSGEPSALVLSGRSAVAQRMLDQAIKYFEEAIANDPMDPRLKGILAATYLSKGGSPQAYALMRRASEVDPLNASARNRVGPLALSTSPVREAIEQFRQSASEERNASVASSAMGLLYYHLGDSRRSRAAIERALRIDMANVTALVYDAQLALDRGDAKRAEKSALKVLSIERGAALGHLMLARALRAMKKPEKAREQYRSALRSNPGLLSAKVEIAAIALEDPEGSPARKDAALKTLKSVYQINPHSLQARLVMLEAGL